MPGIDTPNLSPAPILDLFESYAGSFLDLDRGLEINGDGLRRSRDELVSDLRRLGVNPGDRLLFAVGNGPGFVAAFAAVLTVGGSPVLLHAETPPAELKRLAAAYDARFIVCENWSNADLESVGASATRLPLGPCGGLTFAEINSAISEERTRFPPIPGVPLHPTSGTTGTPKIAVRHGAAAIAEPRNYQQAMDITAGDTVLCVVPMSHAYGFGMCAMLALVSGARIVSSRRFNPHTVLRAFREQTITVFPAVPAMIHLLLVGSRGRIEGLPARVLSAGAPLPEQTARAFLDKAGQPICALYGSTETGGICVNVNANGAESAGCVGPAMKAVSARIRTLPDAGELRDGVGRVAVKSPSMMAGYLSRQGIDASSLTEGWFVTGDLGYVDEAHRMHLVGRESDVINVFGMKVIPSEVEEVILAVPGVTDVKVYAGQHRSGSQIVKVAVAGSETLDVAAIRVHCAHELVSYKRPEVVTRMELLPRTPTGKIIRDQLP